LRHTFANSAVKQMQPQVLQSLLGHADLRVTSVYVKADATDMVRGMRAMQRAAKSPAEDAPGRRTLAVETQPKPPRAGIPTTAGDREARLCAVL
jgi:hypothetical protein